MFENDDIDFYAEDTMENDPTSYKIGADVINYTISKKTIKVKDAPDEEFTIKTSIHGPIMNDFIGFKDSNKDIAMDWIYTKLPNQMLEATYDITHAKNLEAFKKGASKIVAPGLNVMYGDAQNNIAWFAAGKLYRHTNGVDTHFILNGANEQDDKLVYIDFKDNPQAINPPTNYVYSANNQPSKIQDSILYPGYYLPEDRAKRITDVLDDLNNISTDEMKKLITDVTSSKVPEIVNTILHNIDETKLENNEVFAYKILQAWHGDFKLNKVAPTIYTKFKYLFLKNIFRDELGKEGFEKFMDTHIVKHQYNKQILGGFSVWNDDITTKQIEDKKQIITKSFKEAISQLENQLGEMINEWTWNKVHIVEHSHPIGDKVEALHDFFNVGPFSINGTNEVLNNQIFHLNSFGIYKVTGGPSTRRIVDFSDVENNSFAIIPTGQSGNPFSKHYKDLADKFVQGGFYKMLLNKDTIQQSEDKLLFKVKK